VNQGRNKEELSQLLPMTYQGIGEVVEKRRPRRRGRVGGREDHRRNCSPSHLSAPTRPPSHPSLPPSL